MPTRGLRGDWDRQRERFEQLGILEFESNTTSDVDHDMDVERRVRAGEIELAEA